MKSPKTALYRHFDAGGALLYAGISNDQLRRLCQHKDRAHWFGQIARVDIEWLESREDAIDAERRVIHSENPRWNIRRDGSALYVADGPFAIVHPASNRLDGWYYDRADAEGVLEYFESTWPLEHFKLTSDRTRAPAGCRWPEERILRGSNANEWAKSEAISDLTLRFLSVLPSGEKPDPLLLRNISRMEWQMGELAKSGSREERLAFMECLSCCLDVLSGGVTYESSE